MQVSATLDPKKTHDQETNQLLGFDPSLKGGRESIDEDRWSTAAVIKHPQGDFLLIG